MISCRVVGPAAQRIKFYEKICAKTFVALLVVFNDVGRLEVHATVSTNNLRCGERPLFNNNNKELLLCHSSKCLKKAR